MSWALCPFVHEESASMSCFHYTVEQTSGDGMNSTATIRHPFPRYWRSLGMVSYWFHMDVQRFKPVENMLIFQQLA
jgi:hypothetical protein